MSNPWKAWEISEKHWKSRDNMGNPEKAKTILGNLEKAQEIPGKDVKSWKMLLKTRKWYYNRGNAVKTREIPGFFSSMLIIRSEIIFVWSFCKMSTKS